jgi:hypothetical protein
MKISETQCKQILDLSKKYNMRFTAYFGKKKLKDVEKTKL